MTVIVQVEMIIGEMVLIVETFVVQIVAGCLYKARVVQLVEIMVDQFVEKNEGLCNALVVGIEIYAGQFVVRNVDDADCDDAAWDEIHGSLGAYVVVCCDLAVVTSFLLHNILKMCHNLAVDWRIQALTKMLVCQCWCLHLEAIT